MQVDFELVRPMWSHLVASQPHPKMHMHLLVLHNPLATLETHNCYMHLL